MAMAPVVIDCCGEGIKELGKDTNERITKSTVNDRLSSLPLPIKPPPLKVILTNKPPLPNKPPGGLFEF